MIDENGFPGATGLNGEFDGGDTAAIIGTIVALDPYAILMLMEKVHFLIPAGFPIRHPDFNKWYGRHDRFSRDQLIPIICAGIATGDPRGFIDLFFRAHRRRKFLTAWNTRKNGTIDAPKKWPDFTGPEVWALWIRFKNPWWKHLVLWFLDLETLFGSIGWRLFPRNNVTRNHMLVALITKAHSPTFVSKLAFRINDWADLLVRWWHHVRENQEYDTAVLFVKALQNSKGRK